MSYHDIYSIVYLPPNLLRALALRPVRRFVVAGSGKLPRLSAIGQHGPDLPGAGTRGFKNEVPAIRRPTGSLVASCVVGQFDNLAAGDFHDVDVVIITGPAPTKRQQLAVGRPGRINQIPFVREVEILRVGAVGIHQVQLGYAAAIADKSDGLAGFWIPGWRGAGAVRKRQAFKIAAAGIGGKKLRTAVHAGGENNSRSVWTPRRRTVGALEAREADHFARIHRIHADLRAHWPVSA